LLTLPSSLFSFAHLIDCAITLTLAINNIIWMWWGYL
jgi:hypothetical protein